MTDRDKERYKEKEKERDQIMRRTVTTAWVAGIFTVVIAMLLVINYIHLRQSDPLESRATEALLERLADDPGNAELMREIRHLDFLSRKAYFNTLWQIRAGALPSCW